jgi:hypothetical protein
MSAAAISGGSPKTWNYYEVDKHESRHGTTLSRYI